MVQEKVSVFDMFKIGIGPSSSHTLGPWRAAERFLNDIPVNKVKAIRVFLYGSLANTGKGHGTDVVVMLGLSGEDPVRFDTQLLHSYVQSIRQTKKIRLAGEHEVSFVVRTGM